jgi:hypothetical protein
MYVEMKWYNDYEQGGEEYNATVSFNRRPRLFFSVNKMLIFKYIHGFYLFTYFIFVFMHFVLYMVYMMSLSASSFWF